MEQRVFPYHRKPHYYETDKMGIVHHSNYIRWFEEARLDLMEQAGFPYQEMEAEGVLIPVLGVTCDYLHYVTYEDEVSIFCKVTEYSGVKMSLNYEVYRNSDHTLCASGTSAHCFVSKDMRVLRIKRDYPKIDAFFKELCEIKR